MLKEEQNINSLTASSLGYGICLRTWKNKKRCLTTDFRSTKVVEKRVLDL